MRKSLKSIEKEIIALQERFRRYASLDVGVIRGGVDTTEIQENIHILAREYNSRAKRTKFYGGRIVSRTA